MKFFFVSTEKCLLCKGSLWCIVIHRCVLCKKLLLTVATVGGVNFSIFKRNIWHFRIRRLHRNCAVMPLSHVRVHVSNVPINVSMGKWYLMQFADLSTNNLRSHTWIMQINGKMNELLGQYVDFLRVRLRSEEFSIKHLEFYANSPTSCASFIGPFVDSTVYCCYLLKGECGE